jgi:hypothetical protein
VSEKIVYLVQRYEMPLDDAPGSINIPDKVFTDSKSAQEYCTQQDPDLKGLKYTCPCGCGNEHWRSWGYESIVMEG